MTETKLKNWNNIQPQPNPKPRQVVKVQLCTTIDGHEVPAGYGFIHLPQNGKLQKIKTAAPMQQGS